MALGLEMFRVLRKAKKEHEATTLVSYPSGLMPLDYLNGQRIQVFDSDNNVVEEYDSVGFVEGTMITVVADPGLGKTTLTQQIAVEICSQFDNSFIIHEDIEQSSHINRVYNITAQKPSWIKTHYALYQETHAESFIDRTTISQQSGDLMTSNYAANVLDNNRTEPIGKYGFIRGMENK